MSEILLPMFSFKSFIVLALIFRVFDPLWIIFVHVVRYRSKFILMLVDIQLFHHHLLKRPSFPLLYCIGTFIKNQLSVNVSLFLYCQFQSIITSLSLSILSWLLQPRVKLKNQEAKVLYLCSFSRLFWKCYHLY